MKRGTKGKRFFFGRNEEDDCCPRSSLCLKPVSVLCVQRAHPRWENRVKVANIYSFDRRLRSALVQTKAWELFEFAVLLSL